MPGNGGYLLVKTRFCKQKKDSITGILLKLLLSGQRAYLPSPCGLSTSAAEELNGRVRDGNGCDLLAMATRIDIGGAL